MYNLPAISKPVDFFGIGQDLNTTKAKKSSLDKYVKADSGIQTIRSRSVGRNIKPDKDKISNRNVSLTTDSYEKNIPKLQLKENANDIFCKIDEFLKPIKNLKWPSSGEIVNFKWLSSNEIVKIVLNNIRSTKCDTVEGAIRSLITAIVEETSDKLLKAGLFLSLTSDAKQIFSKIIADIFNTGVGFDALKTFFGNSIELSVSRKNAMDSLLHLQSQITKLKGIADVNGPEYKKLEEIEKQINSLLLSLKNVSGASIEPGRKIDEETQKTIKNAESKIDSFEKELSKIGVASGSAKF